MFKPFRESSPKDDRKKIESRISADGYVFVKGLIPKRKIEKTKADIMEILKDFGYLEVGPSKEPRYTGKEDKYNDFLEGIGPIVQRVAQSEALNAVIHSSEVTGMLRKVWGGDVYSWTDNRTRTRTYTPGEKVYKQAGGAAYSTVTPWHQDHSAFQMLDGSEVPFFTVWVPLMDIDEVTGGLALAEGSSKVGFYEHFYRNRQTFGVPPTKEDRHRWLKEGAYPVLGDAKPREQTWLRSDFEMGDALIFHRKMLHRGLPNKSPNFRMSGDFRYQPVGTPMNWRPTTDFISARRWQSMVNKQIDEMGIKGELTDKIVGAQGGMFFEGPVDSPDYSVKGRILERAKLLTPMLITKA